LITEIALFLLYAYDIRDPWIQILFYSNENNEPIHVHVEKGSGEAKIWMDPILEQYAYGFKTQERKEIMRLVKEHSNEIIKSWNEHFKK
jgi:hypothetical protein